MTDISTDFNCNKYKNNISFYPYNLYKQINNINNNNNNNNNYNQNCLKENNFIQIFNERFDKNQIYYDNNNQNNIFFSLNYAN